MGAAAEAMGVAAEVLDVFLLVKIVVLLLCNAEELLL